MIRIERPVAGDTGRVPAFADRSADGETISFHAMNRNKLGVIADLKEPEDLERVRELVAHANVTIQNFRTGVMDRVGLGCDAVRAINPRIVYGSASGYGDVGT